MTSQDETAAIVHGDNVTETASRDLGSQIIVIVDDDVSFRESLVSLIKSFGFRSRAFESAEDLLESDALETGACLITDVQMSGMTGLDMQAAIAKSGCGIPIIVVTSFPDQNVRERAMESGAIAVLKKPFDREEMQQLLQAAFNHPRPDQRDPAAATRLRRSRA